MTSNLHGNPLTRIGQIAIPVHDVERAVAFYRDVLGLPFLFDAPGLAFFMCGDVRLMLSLPDKPEFDHPASIIYYQVDDIDEAHKILEVRGAVFEETPKVVHKTDEYDLWMASLRDVDNNLLALMSEVPKS